MGFGEAITTCFKKYVTFTGRARRSEYWWWYLFCCILNLLSYIPVVGPIFPLALILPQLAVTVRRLHDIGRSGWWILPPNIVAAAAAIPLILALSPDYGHGSSTILVVVGGLLGLAALALNILYIVWLATDGSQEENQYGTSPKYIIEEDYPEE